MAAKQDSPDASAAVLARLRRAVSEPLVSFPGREELAAALSEMAAGKAELIAAAAEIKQAMDAPSLSVAAAKSMRLLLQAQPESPPQASSGASTRKRRDDRRKQGLAKAQAAALADAKKTPPAVLEQPVESLPGIGPAVGLALREKGLSTLADLIWFLPLGYRDERHVLTIGELCSGQYAVATGTVTQANSGYRGRAEVLLSDPATGDALRLSWFRAPGGMVARYRPFVRMRVSGVVDTFRGQLTMRHPKVQLLSEAEMARGDGVVPRYSEVAGVPPKTLRKAIAAALSRGLPHLPEAVPPGTLSEVQLPTLCAAISFLHAPPTELDDGAVQALHDHRTPAHRRLAYEEFFLLELSLHLRKQEEQGVRGEALSPAVAPLSRARAALGFALTAAQERVVAEIGADLRQETPMRRLLQGDVGSGKTAVAMLAAAHAVAAGAQVAFMAPTEVLAEQHFRSLAPVAEALALRSALLLGGARASHRRRVLEGLAEGTIDLVIGTHALLSEGVNFSHLRLVIVDEQHRFGVSQRLRLVDKGQGLSPHLLVMTATPIPRSLTLALHGDLASSVIDEKPAGRIPPVTRAYSMDERDRAYKQLRRALESGGQAYVVCPAIEEAEDQPLRTAEETYRELSQSFAEQGVALLHGRLPPEEKAAAMDRFLMGEVRVLVSTTVIEVGVDVAAANVILIEHAERFGMAQLHQLRGRVGRAGQRSACLLLHEARSEEARERIRTLCESDDGFRIAEEDLRLRGPGELFGRRQSGLPGFRFGDLRRDAELLAHARDAAAQVIAADPELRLPEHARARAALAAAFAIGGGLVKEEAG